MKAEKLTINSQCTFHWNLEESLDAYAAAGFRNVEPHLNLVKDWLEDRGEPQARDQGVHRGDEGRTENPSPPAAAIEALRVAVACEVSRKEGRPVRVAEVEEDPPAL